jgi:hypothetical protein
MKALKEYKEYMEVLREKLNQLAEKETILSRGEVLELSKEMDKLIYKYYNTTSV